MKLPICASIFLSVVVLVTGCGHKKAPEPAPAPAPEPVAPVAAQDAPVPPPVPYQPSTEPSTRETKDTAYNQEMAQTLNDFLGEYIRANKRIPKDINEMLSLKIITSVPPITGGKKWVIDQRTGKISAQ